MVALPTLSLSERKTDSMSNERPKIKVPLEPIDIIVEMITLSVLALMIIYIFIVYNDLPHTIPTHFNGEGEANGFGNKSMMWLLPGIGAILYIAFSILNRFPHIHNYNINITEENALKNYRFSSRILRFTLLFIMLLFVFIEYDIVSYVNGQGNIFGNWFVTVVIILSLILPIFLIIYKKKMNKS
jgi:uncharacterized membrane protein